MHRAKLLLSALRVEHLRCTDSKHFTYHANLIQKIWRGFHSRRYIHDYYARKKYLQTLTEKNEAMRAQLGEYEKTIQLESEKRKEDAARTEFNEICKKVHHLTSTRAIPGVYNSPYLDEGIKPQAFNVDMETHLKNGFKSTYQWKAPDKKTITKYKQ